MATERTLRWRTLFTLALLVCLASLTAPLAAAPLVPAAPATLQAAFAAAAKETGVPERVLLAVSYNVSRWEQHSGAPSTSGGYGVMHLRDLSALQHSDAKGDGQLHSAAPNLNDPNLYTLLTAAQLLH
ncbi:MAG: N-acetylmuramoyl-L-alanine amidase, partial [Herpetosiphonaceae bacterium]|nr:N-acetylmuramoyl-L-alanine amidase [Herpetosiphonaceae bacterium]